MGQRSSGWSEGKRRGYRSLPGPGVWDSALEEVASTPRGREPKHVVSPPLPLIAGDRGHDLTSVSLKEPPHLGKEGGSGGQWAVLESRCWEVPASFLLDPRSSLTQDLLAQAATQEMGGGRQCPSGDLVCGSRLRGSCGGLGLTLGWAGDREPSPAFPPWPAISLSQSLASTSTSP